MAVSQSGIVGNINNRPNCLAATKSLVFTKTNAKAKLTTMVVIVKNMLTPACLNLLYLKLKSGTALSTSQKKVMPPTKIRARCEDGMALK